MGDRSDRDDFSDLETLPSQDDEPPSSEDRLETIDGGTPTQRADDSASLTDSVDAEPLVGTTLDGKYELLGLLGKGGMGAVYEARHVLIGSRLAVKVLNPEISTQETTVKRFHNEARIAGALGQENIVRVTDMGGLGTRSPYIVMEHLEGESLSARIDSVGRLSIDESLDIASQTLKGLLAVHEAGVVHRDLKPDNVFLCRQEESDAPLVKLLDFGVSKIREPGIEEARLTQTGVVLGTPYYMSPEQAEGLPEADHRIDIYATGAILYECLTGRPPHVAKSYNALLLAIMTQAPDPTAELRPDIPSSLDAIILKALARKPEERFSTAKEFLEAIQDFKKTEGEGSPTEAEGDIPTEAPAFDGSRSARRWWPVASIVVVVCALLGTILVATTGSDHGNASRGGARDDRASTLPPPVQATIDATAPVERDADALETDAPGGESSSDGGVPAEAGVAAAPDATAVRPVRPPTKRVTKTTGKRLPLTNRAPF